MEIIERRRLWMLGEGNATRSVKQLIVFYKMLRSIVFYQICIPKLMWSEGNPKIF